MANYLKRPNGTEDVTPDRIHKWYTVEHVTRAVAESFGSWNWTGSGMTSIKFIMDDNKTAPGVQHISKFGTREAEVLLPSYQAVYVDKVVQVPTSGGGRRFEIHLKDRGRRVKKK